ncbi:hypothetical protein FISHEDRAFT_51969 [Fistulina hepatica ATCC 64428]|nr:hypothetical protein FISHEDRAFT_51969 [Fistulina hepatica ATCC 64428]
MAQLQRSASSIVKSRNGSVISRGFILKTDYYPSGRALDLEVNVHGAPNFRAPRVNGLNVYGAAQPRTQGLRAILSILQCRPGQENQSHAIWFSTREEPMGMLILFRTPRQTLSLSDRAENLEAIEQRMKTDILQEAKRFGGLVLTHNEMASDSEEGAILPTWTAVDHNNVKTSCELWGNMKKQGWNVDDNYLDAYLSVIKRADPLKTSLVFSCGRGAVRTTFAMVVACIVRRKQLIDRGLGDPFNLDITGRPRSTAPSLFHRTISDGVSKVQPVFCDSNFLTYNLQSPSQQSQTESRMLMAIGRANEQQEMNKSVLRLTYLLQQCLQNRNSQSAIELLMAQPLLLDDLRRAHSGNYSVLLSLLGCLDNGLKAKNLVDRVIDANDHVTHLREDILIQRLKYSLTSLDEASGEVCLNRGKKAMEKYFFAVAFASYVEESDNFNQSFSDWVQARTEIWNQVTFLRKTSGSRLNIFAPVQDLSSLSRSGSKDRSLIPGRRNDFAISGGQILGDEYASHVVKNRRGIILRESTLLKSDQWLSESHHVECAVRGAINFRQVPGTSIYALGQPTMQAIDEVVHRVRNAHPDAKRIVWITLREEPIVYINGAVFCLRREGYSLRNMKDYGGISASRLEVLEERLRDDVITEVHSFGGQLLLHSESPDGAVIPVWEDVKDDDVMVLKDLMASRQNVDGVEIRYTRIPVTAERSPDFADLRDLIDVVLRTPKSTSIILNCQLGRGRSTLASVILVLIRQWLESSRLPKSPYTTRMAKNRLMSSDHFPIIHRHSYQIINSLLRVIRKGPAVKSTVDDAIDLCAAVFNIRDSIEESRVMAEQAINEGDRRMYLHKGRFLRRYFELIIFQAYLQSIEPDTMQSFESVEKFVNDRPVIRTFQKELRTVDFNMLKPLERSDGSQGEALPNEVQSIVQNRSGSILSASTILKCDFFSNLQKMALPERIEGAANFRRVPLTLRLSDSPGPTPSDSEAVEVGEKMVCGSGMPSVDGLRRVLQRVNAGPNGSNSVVWTSLREEPVLYVAGRPHVLRIVDRPLENVEATGVTTAMVEAMEDRLKYDVIKEARLGDGRILLHDEVEERPGVFTIVPVWESISEDEILTPREVFGLVQREGYKIDYGRVAITDEQAPLPDALSQLLDRVKSTFSGSGDFIFNCQMGRGRTTTGMVTACLIAMTMDWDRQKELLLEDDESSLELYNSMDGPSEEEAYLEGEYKTILKLVGVLSHGKVAKRLTDRVIDMMQDVQNLRKAIYDYKLKVEACAKGSAKERQLRDLTVNYLYRYGTLIAFANYLIEMTEHGVEPAKFPQWLSGHSEITKLLGRRSLD